GDEVKAVLTNFDETQPWKSVPALLKLRRKLRALGDNPWADEKLNDLDGIIGACLGLHFEAVTAKPLAQPGESLGLQIEAINRSPEAVTFKSVGVLKGGKESPLGKPLLPHELLTEKTTISLPNDLPFSEPYWLRDPGTVGTYTVTDQTLIGQPENPPPFPVSATIQVGGEEITYALEPRFRKVDRVAGEVSEPLVIAPPAFVQLPRPVFVFGRKEAKTINLRVIAASEKFHANIALEVPPGWKVEPASLPVDLEAAETETSCTFQVTPPTEPGEGKLRAVFVSESGARTASFSRERISYPHIEPQTLISPAEAKLVRARIENKAAHVGYIPGAGDAIPDSLREIGSEVEVLSDGDVKRANLARFDAIVLGVRAYNVHPDRISAWYPELLAYAQQGGVVVVQYNTTPGPKPNELPHALNVSHDR